VVLAAVVVSRFGPILADFLRPPPDRVVDFFQDWASGRNRIEGLPVYTSQEVTAPRYLGVPRNPSVAVNAHPPSAVLLTLPLALLPYHNATFAWNLLSVACLGGSLVVVVRSLNLPFSPSWLAPLVAVLFLCDPLYEHVYQAQWTLFLLFLLTMAWAADRSGRPLAAGALVGIAGAVKLFPCFLLLYFAARGRWRSVAAGIGAVAAVAAVAEVVLGPGVHSEFSRDVLPRTVLFRSYAFNASLAGFWCRLFDPGAEIRTIAPLLSSRLLALAATVLSDVLVAGLMVQVARGARIGEDADRSFGLALTAMLLVSPVTWSHSLFLLLVPLAIAWKESASLPATRLALVVITLAVWLDPEILYNSLQTPGRPALPIHSISVLSFKVYALIGLLGLGARRPAPRESSATSRQAVSYQPEGFRPVASESTRAATLLPRSTDGRRPLPHG
jgi:hypothetical protein